MISKKKGMALAYIIFFFVPCISWTFFRVDTFGLIAVLNNYYDLWIFLGAIISIYAAFILMLSEKNTFKKKSLFLIPLKIYMALGVVVMVESFFEASILIIPLFICHFVYYKIFKTLILGSVDSINK